MSVKHYESPISELMEIESESVFTSSIDWEEDWGEAGGEAPDIDFEFDTF